MKLLQPILRLDNTSDSRRLSHAYFHWYLSLMRGFVLLVFVTRYVWFQAAQAVPEWAQSYEIPLLITLGITYLLMIMASSIAIYLNPLLSLQHWFHEALAYFEIAFLILAIVLTGYIGTHLTLFFFVPFLALTRVRSRSLAYIAGLTIITISIVSLVLQRISTHQGERISPSALVDIVVIILVFTILSRSWENGRSKLIGANLDYVLHWLQREYRAELAFLRIHLAEKEQDSLVLVSNAPHAYLDHSRAYNFMCLNAAARNSLAALVYQSGEPETVSGQSELLNRMIYKGFVETHALQLGIAFPLSATDKQDRISGTISLYWSTQDGLQDRGVELAKPVQQIAGYIDDEMIYAQLLAEQVSTLHIHQAESNRFNYWLEQIQLNTDLWGTADLIVEAASELSGYENAFIYFWHEADSRYRLHAPFGIKIDQRLSIPEQLTMPQIPKEKTYPITLGSADQRWHAETHFSDCLAFPMQSSDKTIGLLVIATRKGDRLSIGQQELILSLSRHSAVDLRNCQLLNKANTTADMTKALSRMIHDLFSPTNISGHETDLYQSIAEIIKEAVQASSCSFGLLQTDSGRLQVDSFVTTEEHIRGRVDLNDPKTMNLVRKTLASEVGLYKIDYEEAKEARNVYVRWAKIIRTYGALIQLSDRRRGMMFINYCQVSPRIEYQINQVLPLVQEHVSQAWSAWKAWSKVQNYQQQIWKDDLHDQLNELQFNVTLPLEQLLDEIPTTNNATRVEKVREVHRNAKSIETTLKHIMNDMRHPVIVEEGLLAALQYLEGQNAGLTVTVVKAEGEPPHRVANAIYRLLREAIHNGLKHGGTKVSVSIELYRDRLQMQIADNGPGFDQDNQRGSGMALMKYQADLLDADLKWLTSNNGHPGTVVQFNWQAKQ